MTYQVKPYGNIWACVFNDDWADATFHDAIEDAQNEADALNESEQIGSLEA